MNPSEIQRRNSRRPVQLRDNGGDKLPTITGYAAVYYREGDEGTRFQMWRDCEERILPGAFDNALRRDDPIAKFNHEDSRILGRASSGTLRLSVDKIGLRYEIDPPNTEAGREVVELIRRGDVYGSSFAFVPDGKYLNPPQMRNGKPYYIAEVRDCHLYDVGPVTDPAYQGTAAGFRGTGAGSTAAARDWLDLTLTLAEVDTQPARRGPAAARDISRIDKLIGDVKRSNASPRQAFVDAEDELDFYLFGVSNDDLPMHRGESRRGHLGAY